MICIDLFVFSPAAGGRGIMASSTVDLQSVRILRIPFCFFRESVAGGRAKQSPLTLQQLEALATS